MQPSLMRIESNAEGFSSTNRDSYVRNAQYIPMDASKMEVRIHNFLSNQNVFKIDIKETL